MPRKKKIEIGEIENPIKEVVENVEAGVDDIKELEEHIEEILDKNVISEEEINKRELSKKAEAESTTEEISLAEKKKAILEKARKLKEKIEKPETKELKEQIKIKKRTDMLIPLEEYVKSGIYLGTRVVTPDMRPFVYRRRADGLAIFNTDLIDEKLKEAIKYLSQFNPEEVILVCKRQSGWRTAEMFGRLTGIRTFTKKYPAGILTNTQLEDFFENELTIICDAWLDKNALNDTLNVNKKVLMICDTNNLSKRSDKVVIGNNKSAKSLGIIFYLLARGYCKEKGIEANIPDLDWWTSEEEEVKGEKVEFGV